MKERVRVGVVGCGAISQVVHLPILTERDDVEVVAVADRDAHRGRSVASRFGVARVLAADELLSEESIEAVFVCTPNHLHEAQAVAALEAGKDVLVERPIALSAEGAEKVTEAATRTGRTVIVGMSHRWRADVAALRSFVAGGELGPIHSIRCAWLSRSLPSGRERWRQRREEAGGGALMDVGVQAFDLALWLADYPSLRRIKALVHFGDEEVEDSATVLAEGDDGLAVSIEVSRTFFAGEDRHHARVMGSDGTGSLPPLEVHKQVGGRPLEVTPKQPRPRGGENLYMNQYRREIDHFVRTVSAPAAAPPPEEQAVLMGIIEAAYRSAREGTQVEL